MRATAANRLLDHYRAHARRLPWRSPPGSGGGDPYRVWLSEVMLQQTGVAAVVPRFEHFVERWPTLEALAAADEAEVLGQWAGLGYYARARNLVACARAIAARGGFPEDEAGWRELPGIGAYTAAAIAAIAFGRPAAAIDTNVERVFARLGAIELEPAAARAAVRKAVEAMLPSESPGDFAQALMDLGATICRPRAPDCPRCPLSADCRAHALGRAEDFPVKRQRAARPLRHGIAHWHERQGKLLLVRRPPRGMLGGMAALPGGEWGDETPAAGTPLAQLRHDFTHFSLSLTVVAGQSRPPAGSWWHPLGDIAGAGLPTLYRKAVDAVLAQQGLGHAG